MTKGTSSEETILHSEEALDTFKVEKVSEKNLRQPDSYWSWIVCTVGIISNVIVWGSVYSFGMIFPHLLDEFKQGKSNTGKCYNSLKPREQSSPSLYLLFSAHEAF